MSDGAKHPGRILSSSASASGEPGPSEGRGWEGPADHLAASSHGGPRSAHLKECVAVSCLGQPVPPQVVSTPETRYPSPPASGLTCPGFLLWGPAQSPFPCLHLPGLRLVGPSILYEGLVSKPKTGPHLGIRDPHGESWENTSEPEELEVTWKCCFQLRNQLSPGGH